MLTLFSTSDYRGRVSRRQLLQIGSAWGAMSLSSGAFAAKTHSFLTNRSVVFLNLQGGPTQYETFDPNMQAPEEIRSITGEVKTSLPGITFGGTLPQLAKQAHRMAVVRSFRHGISDHGRAAKLVMAGGNATQANMASLFSRAAGLTNYQTGLPQAALVTPGAVDSKYNKLYASKDRVTQIGTLAPIYKPFDPSAGGEVLDNMRLHLPSKQWDSRRSLLQQLDSLRRSLDHHVLESADRFRQQAFNVLTRGVAQAFDLSQENPRTVARYDTSMFEPTDAVKQRNEYAQQFSPIALGKQLLLARRLCEAGCGFVTVTCGGWDMHGGGKEFTMKDGLASLTPALDKAASAFIQDIYDRGLDQQILFVITGEFGRTPTVNKDGGRDHWGNMCPLVFVGGGLPMGQVIGRSDAKGAVPASAPISIEQVRATILETLIDRSALRLKTGIPQQVIDEITGGEPIRELA